MDFAASRFRWLVLWLGCLGVVFACGSTKDTPPVASPTSPLSLSPSASRVLADGTSVTIKITAKDATNGSAGSGTVSLATTAGVLTVGGAATTMATLANGEATAELTCDAALDAQCLGLVTLTATWNGAGASTAITFYLKNDAGTTVRDGGPQITGVPSTITYTSILCGGASCGGILGIKGSGFQEQGAVTFIVRDSLAVPVGFADVAFALEDAPSGTRLIDTTAKTNAAGVVSANVESGQTLGAFKIRATVSLGVETISPPIGIRGVKPANKGFSLQCDAGRLRTRVAALPPAAYTSACQVKLVDRFNNPVGRASTINFKPEAGSMPSSIQSTGFDPGGNNANEGSAAVVFNTVGNYPPRDVPPDTDNGELSGPSGNPRDGLVTLLAYVQGEEFFEDDNNNGTRDPGERFIDQGEPFVDENDDNVWNAGEFYADVSPSNGRYDGPDGAWQSNTTIWTTTWIMYTGAPATVGIDPPAGVSGSGTVGSPYVINKGANATFTAHALDDFGAPMHQTATIGIQSRVPGTRGAIALTSNPLIDGLGIGLQRVRVSSTDPETSCDALVGMPPARPPICKWWVKTGPYNTVGAIATLQVTGVALTDMTPPANEAATLRTTVPGASPVDKTYNFSFQ